MKFFPYCFLLALSLVAFSTPIRAEESKSFPDVAFVGPGASKNPISRDQFLILVVEGAFLSYESNPIPEHDVVDYVNNLLKTKKVSYIAVHTREGVKYGDVIRAVDVLRKTSARQIGVSMVELPQGREP